MNSIVNIMIIIDTKSIINAYGKTGTYDTPQLIGREFSYVFTESRYVKSEQGISDLNIFALIGDDLIFDFIALSGSAQQSVVLYDLKHFAGDHVTSPFKIAQYTEPTPIPNIDNQKYTGAFIIQNKTKSILNKNILKYGTEHFFIQFYITQQDRNTGEINIIGYYQQKNLKIIVID